MAALTRNVESVLAKVDRFFACRLERLNVVSIIEDSKLLLVYIGAPRSWYHCVLTLVCVACELQVGSCRCCVIQFLYAPPT
jgi:hypothetical protein